MYSLSGSVIQALPEPYIPTNKREPAGYPTGSFPPVMKNVVRTLNDETRVPEELIAAAVLSAGSLACQSHIQVLPPYSSAPMPCSLFLLTLAVSGEGKTTISKKVMEPFYQFAEKMIQENLPRMDSYLRLYNIWKIRRKALAALLYTAIKKGAENQEEERMCDEHDKAIPQKPPRMAMLYEDTTPKALLEGLEEYSEAGLLSDEAITFFKGYAKNNLGLLNKAWDGDTYEYRRADDIPHTIKPSLTLALMVQPPVFENYLSKHGEISKGSGFLSRFLYINTISTLNNRRSNIDHSRSDEALCAFHGKINLLLERQKDRFYKNNTEKLTLTLSEDAKALWTRKQSELNSKIGSGQALEHISEIVVKSGANALRIAAILSYIDSNERTCIPVEIMRCAFGIIEWHLDEADRLFYPFSERNTFVESVYEMFEWLKEQFFKSEGAPIRKNDVNKIGPNRLRNTKTSQPILEQLIALELICLIKSGPHSAVSIAMPIINKYNEWAIPTNYWAQNHNPIIGSKMNIKGKYGRKYFDLDRLKY
ncbi:YfjI family protein [Winslowiella sp. 2C04]|uniref:YfjI family protein n=1 Tax=Winslowiella sp. 2C04 TaxID=3416179 RepID=UPI003CEFB671